MSSPLGNASPSTTNVSLSQSVNDHRLNKRKLARLDDLPAEILLEVLIRVPPKAARSMKAVSRHWNSIISSAHYAAARSIFNYPSTDECALLLEICTEKNQVWFPTAANPMVLNRTRLDLSYVTGEYNLHSWITSTSEDLILIEQRCNILFVYNPFTKESVLLPPLDAPGSKTYVIVCQPGLQGLSRYRVLSYRQERDNLFFDNVFLSETGRWNRVVVTPRPGIYFNTSVVSYRGKLYWYSGKDIVAYDPFQDTSTLIRCSLGEPPCRHYWLGVVGGSLTLSSFGCDQVETPKETKSFCNLAIWEYDRDLGQLIFKKKSRFQRPPCQKMNIFMIALHPTKDVIYLVTDYCLGLHDFSNECDNFFQVDVPSQLKLYPYGVYPFLVARPWFPTPVCYVSH